MNQICKDKDCTGCGTCSSICHYDAIKMKIANNGFLYPVIDTNKCIGCKQCITHCPSIGIIQKKSPISCYLSWTNNKRERINSSSGGVFSTIASYILEHKGIVFGAAYDDNMNVCHRSIESKQELALLQGSKYVQSNLKNTYKEVLFFLKKNRLVYFVGTPCQISGLYKYLNKEYSNLLTSDLICHGCPSNNLFKQQINELKTKTGGTIVDFKFRSKLRFGQGYDLHIVCKKNKKYISKFYNAELMPFFYGFWHNITLRESCYSCKYTTLERMGDITLADYWLVKKTHPKIKTSKGTSLILVNSEKGEKILLQCKREKSLTLIEDDVRNAIKIQGHLRHPVKMPLKHTVFMRDYEDLSWEELKRKYLTPTLSYIIKMRIRNIVKIITFYRLWK